MPFISSVSMSSFKGQDRVVDLQPRTVITGPVGSGKSAVADAIRFAFLGFVPAAGRLPASTVKFASGPEMSVTVQLGEKTFRRSLPAQTRKATAYASWVPPSENAETHALNITRLAGRDIDEAAESLDLRDLLRAGPSIRAQRINALLDATSGDAASRWTRLRALLLSRLTGAPAEVAAAIAESHLTPAQKAAIDRIGERQLREWLALGLDEAIEQAKRGKKLATDAAKTIVTKPTGYARRPAAEADAERQKVAQEGASLRVRMEQAESTKRAREAAETLLAGLRGVTGDPAAIRAQAASIEDPAEISAPEPVSPDVAADEARIAALDAEAQAKLDARPEIPSPKPAQVANEEALRALALAKQSPWRAVEQVASDLEARGQLERTISDDTFLVDRARTLRDLAAKHGGNTEALEAAVDRALVDLQAALKLAEDAKAARAQLAEDAKRLRAESDGLRAGVAQRRSDAETTNRLLREQFESARRDRAGIIAANAAVRRQLCEQADSIERARIQLAAEESKLAALPESTVDVEALRAQHAALTARYSELSREVTHAQTVEADAKANAQAMEDQMLADTTRDVWAAYQWALETLRATDLAERAGPILSRMDAFFAAAGMGVKPYMRATKSSVEFGWTRDGVEVSIDTMSGGETVLYCTALAAAVIALRNPTVKVLLIEAAEVGDLWDSLLAGLAAIEADNVIVTTCATVGVPVGWQLITCERPTAVATTF